jgi:acyl-CoA dehydrogenase
MFIPKHETDATGILEAAFLATIACEPIDEKLRKAMKKGKLAPWSGIDLDSLAKENGLITPEEYAQWSRKEALRRDVIKVDDFPQDFGRAEIVAAHEDETVKKMKAA